MLFVAFEKIKVGNFDKNPCSAEILYFCKALFK
jgi:hypothetical protein